uniref:Suppressor of cytokine signaling 7 n=1 Tax=Labrus bergylta TaxID=56723 RepID=A0A3Q3EN89_9LABR
MNDAQQDLSPDFVLMRLVSAAEYDRLDEPDDLMSGGGGGGFGPVKSVLGHHGGGFDLDPSGPSPGLGSASPHYSSPLPGKGELDGGLMLTQASPGSEAPLSPPPPEDFAVAAQRFVDYPVQHGSAGHGSRAQLMVFQNLLRSGDRILESGPGPGEENLHPQPQILQWHPVLRLSKGTDGSQMSQALCHRHRLLTDRLAKWPPKTCPSGGEDPVLALARRLGQLSEGREGGRGGGGGCSCHSVLASGTGGEDPSETSDALLVLEGLGSEEVGGLTNPPALSGLQVSPESPPTSILAPSPRPPHQHQSRSQPQSRATTPKLGLASGGAGRCASPLVVLEGDGGKEGEKTPRGKSRKGGSLKVRLRGLLDKRPSLASSTSSGGSLLDVWGSTCSTAEQDSSETVSLVDVDISRRGLNPLHPPTPPPPPRRSLSLLGTSSSSSSSSTTYFSCPCHFLLTHLFVSGVFSGLNRSLPSLLQMISGVLLSSRVSSVSAVWGLPCSLCHPDRWPCPPLLAPFNTA